MTRGSVEYWAEHTPDAVAIIDGGLSTTWRRWNERANAMANALAERGITHGDIVVVRLRTRTEWMLTQSALGKLGCRLLGLNWRLTPGEIRQMLTNTKVAALICDDSDPAALLPALEGQPIRVAVSLDHSAEGFVDFSTLLLAEGPARVAAGNPPLIIFTSGTTGLPKGVVMGGTPPEGADAARRLAEYQRSVRAERPQRPGDVALITLPMHHGAGPSAVANSVLQGNKMVVMRRFEPEEALRLIAAHRVTYWRAVPTMYQRIAVLPVETLAKYDVSSIRILGVGAAPISRELKAWVGDYFGQHLSENYGSTEAGMITGLPATMQALKPGSSGRPYRHVEISVRAADRRSLPAGETGEIWVKTPAVIRQYLNGEPLGEDQLDSEGFFRTGDIGRVDEEGYLYITDRAKDMIVSGGVNIYPAEIEAVIRTHPAVQDVAVIGIPDDDFGEAPKAFVELRPGQSVDPEAILAHTRTILASYKRPKAVEVTPSLPRNGMGKVLKRDLRAPYWEGRERKV
ncbi:AMP-binding protein [Bradyrhizobium sp. Pear76]|uniref:class I adenylate-forming enzyme family protein n=1 Tax=Bradyrhizobium oropedii TaxID=1571201 RepID=UPI001E45128B|nr:AMP-binding protein [Bradyrhizobium oropedii]MCC8967092.1 AMP-binding protein [Bradyrhizobium oropedii]